MGRSHPHGSVRNKKSVNEYPEVYIDKAADFASIKIAPGIESRSYVKDGIVICEDQKGRVLEIQLLNLKALLSPRKRLAA
jgi:hypothetical protein